MPENQRLNELKQVRHSCQQQWYENTGTGSESKKRWYLYIFCVLSTIPTIICFAE